MHVADGQLIVDTYDTVSQQCTSHLCRHRDDGTVGYTRGRFRYIWPADCDLMAELSGMALESRYEDWRGMPFTDESERHVSVWQKLA